MIDKGLYKNRVGLKKGSNKDDNRQSYSASQTTSGRSRRSAPRSSPFSGNESRQQYSATQTATGAVKGGGSKRPGRKDYSTRFVSGDEGRDSRDAFIRSVQQTNPRYTGGPQRNKPRTLGQFFGGVINSLPGLNFLRNLNQRIRNTDFVRSKNLMDYLDMKKFGGYDEREMARRINLDEAKLLQDRIDAGEFDGIGSLNFGDTTVPDSSYDMAGVNSPFARQAPDQVVSQFLPDTDIFNQQTTSYQKRPEEVETDIFFRPQIKPEEGGILDPNLNIFKVNDLRAELTDKQKRFIDSKKFPLQENLITPQSVFDTITNPDLGIYDTGTFGFGAQEPTTTEEYNNYLRSLGLTQTI